jgi:diguanylate cyclase (GGDEF)-like protein/PAS domain S-box-containing protein
MRGWAYDWDVPGDRFWYTDGWQEVLGLADDKLLGTTRDFGRLVHVDDQERALAAISAHLAGKGPAFEAEYRVRTGDGSWRWLLDRGRVIARDHRGRPLRAVGIRTDITERKTAEELTTWRAGHDTLTGLANRALFQAELECALESASRTGGIVGVLMLDLDRFKQVNDTYGHDVGDELLRMVADRLQRATRGSDIVARLGGDEFAVILPTLGTRGSIARPAEAIMAALKRPFLHQGRELDSRASVGVTLYPDDGATAGELLKNADMALYEAKARGRGCCVAYRPGMRRSLEKHVRIAQAARDALSKNRVGAYYQPKVCLKSGRVVGFEALLRWRGPDGRLRAPSSLASAFADQHLAGALGDRMLKTIIDDMRRWQDQGVDFGHVALNTAESELGDENFADKVLRRLADAGLDPRCLEIEVTENVFIGRAAERVRGNLEAFEAAGVGIALDDFGTGYASLTHLKSYPVSTLKVDRSFVRDIESDRGDAAIVRAVIALGRSLGKVVVAEGVETEAQAAFLRAEGCPLAQGFLYAPALAAGRVPRLAGTYLHPVEAKPLAA